jgi:hypothetical protein
MRKHGLLLICYGIKIFLGDDNDAQRIGEGFWFLVSGFWFLVSGFWFLAGICARLSGQDAAWEA